MKRKLLKVLEKKTMKQVADMTGVSPAMVARCREHAQNGRKFYVEELPNGAARILENVGWREVKPQKQNKGKRAA